MRDVAAELKSLRLYGMATAWEEVAAQCNSAGLQTSRWLVEHLLQSEHTDRAMRSIRYQMHLARFPVHRDLAGFDFSQSKVDESLIKELADLAFTEAGTTWCSSAVPEPGRPIWPRPWGSRGLPAMAGRSGFTPPSIW